MLWLFSALAIADFSSFSQILTSGLRGMLQDSHSLVDRLDSGSDPARSRHFTWEKYGRISDMPLLPCYTPPFGRYLPFGLRASVAFEGSGGGKLAELVADHIFRYIHRNMLAAVVNRKCVTNEIREDCRSSAPCLHDTFFSPASFISSTLLQQHRLYVRTLLNASAH